MNAAACSVGRSCEASERGAGRRGVEPGSLDTLLDGADDAHLELARATRLDQLAAERAQQRLCDRGQTELAHPLEPQRRRPDQRVAREPAEELRVVGVDGGEKSHPLEALLALRAQHDAAVDRLGGRSELDALADPHRRREDAVAELTRGVARVLRAERERVRAGGADDPLEGQLVRVASASASTPRSYARRRIGSA